MSKPSRRSVIRTGAWAVPAVATVTAAPAFASVSQESCVSVACVVRACRQSSTHHEHLSTTTPSNTTGSGTPTYSVTLRFTSCACTMVTILGWDMTGTPAASVSPSTFDVSTGSGTVQFTVREAGTPGSTLTVIYSVDGVQHSATIPLGEIGTCCSGSDDRDRGLRAELDTPSTDRRIPPGPK